MKTSQLALGMAGGWQGNFASLGKARERMSQGIQLGSPCRASWGPATCGPGPRGEVSEKLEWWFPWGCVPEMGTPGGRLTLFLPQDLGWRWVYKWCPSAACRFCYGDTWAKGGPQEEKSSSTQNGLWHLWGPVQKEYSGPLLKNDEEFQEGGSRALKQSWGLLSGGLSLVIRSYQGSAVRPDLTEVQPCQFLPECCSKSNIHLSTF